jgi:hypothetical protein
VPFRDVGRAVFATVIVLASVACWNPTAPDAVVGKPFNLKVGAMARLPGGVLLTFDRVSTDSLRRIVFRVRL